MLSYLWYMLDIHLPSKLMAVIMKIGSFLVPPNTIKYTSLKKKRGPSWLWSYGSWSNDYLCNQCLSLLKLWVRTPFRWGVLDTTLCGKVCQWLATGRLFSPGTPVSSTNKTQHHDIAEILLKVALNTINLIQAYNYKNSVLMTTLWFSVGTLITSTN